MAENCHFILTMTVKTTNMQINSHRILDLHIQPQNYICRNTLPAVRWKDLCLAGEGSRASSAGLCRSIWEGWCSQV